MQEKLDAVEGTICRMDIDDPDAKCILEQHTEQILDLKIELKGLVDLDTGDPILRSQNEVEQTIFRCSLAIKKRRHSIANANVASIEPKAQSTWSQTPKIGCAYLWWQCPELEVFLGSIPCGHPWPNWRCTCRKDGLSWECPQKDNAAKWTIDGLTKSGEHYEEAQARFDRPRLIYVRRIVDTLNLKDGNGKGLRNPHDTVVQLFMHTIKLFSSL